METVQGFDVVIVGGGPAGAACGIELQRRGVKSCIVDRAVFPRPKLCGGLLTEKTWDCLRALCPEAAFGPAVEAALQRVALHGDGPLVAADCGAVFRIADRTRLDFGLIEQYRALGGTVFEGEQLLKLEGRTLVTDRHRFPCRAAVAADGANSRLRRLCGLELKGMGFCLEAELPRGDLPEEIRIQFPAGFRGYGWVFPHGELARVGIGAHWEPGTDYPAVFRAFLDKLGIREPVKPLGAFVPYGRPLQKLTARDHVLFVGDAAGLVDPLYGEGLYYALLSGSTAGRCLAEENGFAAYEAAMAPHLRDLRDGERLKRLFFRPFLQRKVLGKLRGKTAFLRFFADRQIARRQYEYRAFGRLWRDYRKGQ